MPPRCRQKRRRGFGIAPTFSPVHFGLPVGRDAGGEGAGRRHRTDFRQPGGRWKQLLEQIRLTSRRLGANQGDDPDSPVFDGERAPDFAIFAENGYFSEARIAV